MLETHRRACSMF